MTGRNRVSQRAPASCKQCTRRKVKCSKQIPCAACIARGAAEECSRETVVLSKQANPTLRKTRRQRRISEPNVLCSPSSLSPGHLSLGSPDQNHATALGQSVLGPNPENEARRSIQNARPINSPLPSNDDIPCCSQSEEVPPEIPAQHDHIHPPQRVSTEAALSLESVVWGSHQAVVTKTTRSFGSVGVSTETDFVRAYHERIIIDLHRERVAWMHNVVHMDTFEQECSEVQWEQEPPAGTWCALYYATMSVGFYYMAKDIEQRHNIDDALSLAKFFYRKALNSLQEIDFMANPSLHALQAICMFVPCGYAFGDTRRMITLLSSACCIAQLMQLHNLEERPPGEQTAEYAMQHELKKRVWAFLVIQDSYLVSFKHTYSIQLNHSQTPPPLNCSESLDDLVVNSQLNTLSAEQPTQTSYMLLQLKLTNLKRELFDEISSCANISPEMQFNMVLQTDEKMIALRRDLPSWMKSESLPTQAPIFVQSQWRTFRISYTHMIMSIHRTFFCLSFSDKKYYYSQVACLSASHMLLKTYLDTVGCGLVESWTIPANLLSSCIFLSLNLFLSGCNDGFDPHVSKSHFEDRETILQALQHIETSGPFNQMVKRGGIIVRRLLETKHEERSPGVSFTSDEITALVREVENTMQEDDSEAMGIFNLTFDEFLDFSVNS
ncbi:hypothetical protein V2G26_018762 [Clonostachys chloroleuca]